MRYLRILLVDDHEVVRLGLKALLSRYPQFEVVAEATNADEALARAQQYKPDVIIMDIRLPGKSGIEATREITAVLPDVDVIMLTSYAEDELLFDAIRAGASGYLVKDCSTEEIASAVRMAASGETALSPQLAASMLDEVRKLDQPATADEERVITRREEEVLQLIANGCSTPEVAEQLFISQKTVKNHLASIYQKLDARDRTQAVLQAVRMGIVHLD